MMGRPEVPIPEHRPMKAMADYLRHLRQGIGAPSYRRLGDLVHVEQQSLSQTANGNRVGWGRVLLYVQALRRHNEQAVTAIELATLKQLHQLGERKYQLETTRNLRRRQSNTFWSEVDAVTSTASYTAARHRPPGQWDLTVGVTDPTRLSAIHDLTGLYILLTEVAVRYGLDLAEPRRSRPREINKFSWFGNETAPAPPTPQLRHPEELTAKNMTAVIRACGGTEGDCTAWLASLERIHRIARAAAAAAAAAEEDVVRPPWRLLPPAEPPPPAFRHGAHRSRANRQVSSSWPGGALRRPAALGT
uniref:hypothetical protein n=1 Tax=Actinoplanes sp. CA-084688 TaxID=3239901 RepID=UPI003F494880